MMTRYTFLTLALLVVPPPAGAADEAPEQVLHLLLGAPHGMHEISGKEHANRLEQLRKEPGLYVPLLVERLHLENLVQDLASPRERRRARNAAGLLAAQCGEQGRDALKELLPRWHQARDEREARLKEQRDKAPEKPDPKWMDLLRAELRLLEGFAALEQAALMALTPSKDTRFKDVLLERLLSEPHLAMTYVDHLIQVAPYDGDVKNALEQLYDKTEDPMVRRRVYGFLKDGPPK